MINFPLIKSRKAWIWISYLSKNMKWNFGNMYQISSDNIKHFWNPETQAKYQETFLKFEKLVADDDRIYWMQSLILEAIDSKKYNSAESLITYSERYFKSSEEKFIFYSLYKDLRDSKFPLFANSEIVIVLDKPCSSFNGLIEVFIMNGPSIPIARANFSNKEEVSLNNTSSSIPGFDIASAYLNKETVDVKVELKCGESGLEYITEALILLDQNIPSNTYKISPNEWLKKWQ